MYLIARTTSTRNIIRRTRKISTASKEVLPFVSCSSKKADSHREAHAAALRILESRDQTPLQLASSSDVQVLPCESTLKSSLGAQSSGTSNSEVVRVFSRIYAQEEWGVESRSGLGSREDTTREFRTFLEEFLQERRIRSVVDAGCGHWPTGYQRFVHWHQVQYFGIDAVPFIAKENNAYFSNPEHLKAHGLSQVKFQAGDLSAPLPSADLLLVKDVLMHLPTSIVKTFLQNNIMLASGSPRYKFVLLVENEVPFNLRQFMDIEPGQLLPFDISQPPFNAPFEAVFRWRSDEAKVVQLWQV